MRPRAAREGMKDDLIAVRHGRADLTEHFQGSAVAGRLQTVHAPNVVGFLPFKPVDQSIPHGGFTTPVVAVRCVAYEIAQLLRACRSVGLGLRERTGGLGNGFGGSARARPLQLRFRERFAPPQ